MHDFHTQHWSHSTRVKLDLIIPCRHFAYKGVLMCKVTLVAHERGSVLYESPEFISVLCQTDQPIPCSVIWDMITETFLSTHRSKY